MQKVACPGCGAEVNFLSAASVMAVCAYCKTTVLKDAQTVRNIGKMSEVIEDYSPIQITTAGVFEGTGFSVIGRIQVKYDAGFWNEWYVQLDDGSNAWLSDASGQYAFTREMKAAPSGLPAFGSLGPGKTLRLGGDVFTASDVRTAQCTGGQGELPFVVGEGWQARVADFRSGRKFVTLDYSDASSGEGMRDAQPGEPLKLPEAPEGSPTVYAGRAVTLPELKCQLLRGEDQITDSAGRYKGKVGNLECPSCGSPVAFSPGMTTHLVCPACHGEADLSGPKAEAIAAASQVAAESKSVATTLQLGATATIDGAKYTVLGVIRRRDTSAEAGDTEADWTEYELYTPGKGFLWLVETVKGWDRAEVLDEWPTGAAGSDEISLSGAKYKQLYAYPAVVTYAAGSFNWRVSVGDRVDVTEYSCGIARLAAEKDEHEITWSRSMGISANSVRLWFGQNVKADKPGLSAEEGDYRKLARKLLTALFFLNIIPILATDSAALIYSGIAAMLIWLPAAYLDKTNATE